MPHTQGTRSPQWSRWKCVIAIASTSGQVDVFTQPAEHARPAVEEHATPVRLEHVAGMRAARDSARPATSR